MSKFKRDRDGNAHTVDAYTGVVFRLHIPVSIHLDFGVVLSVASSTSSTTQDSHSSDLAMARRGHAGNPAYVLILSKLAEERGVNRDQVKPATNLLQHAPSPTRALSCWVLLWR